MAWRAVVLMKKFPLSRRFVLVFVVAGALGLAIAFGGRLLLSDFIDAAYNGDSFEFINKKLNDDRLEDPAVRTIDYYQQRGASFLNRIVWFYFIGVFPLILGFRRLRQVLVDFFTAGAHPFHLALFRIVVFSLLFIKGNLENDQVNQLDSAALVPLPGWGWVLPYLPLEFMLNPDVMETSRLLFQLCCLAGIIGFYTRTAAVGAAVLGLYVLGVPQFFAKTSHYHFLWWFAILFACSPSGDALSVDAARRAWRSGTQGMPLQAARRYALPIQFALLLLGVAYFFPGFWKFAVNGPEWALSDNLKFKMRYIWFVQGGWLPFFRLDLYPFLYQAGGLLTILFEMGFVIAVLHPRTRVFGVVGATLFHLSNRLFLNVGFSFMVAVVYAAALDWRKVFRWCGRIIFKRRIVLRYQPEAEQNLAAVMQSVDLFGAVDYQADHAAPKECPLWNGAPLRGIRPWIAALLRVPFMGLALLVLLFPVIRRRFQPSRSSASTRPTAVAGALLLVVNILCGAALIDSWPFAVYPTFAGMDKGQVPTLLLAAQNDRGEIVGEVRPFFHPDFRSQFGSNSRLNAYLKRLAGLKRSELEAENKKMEALWNIWKTSNPEVGEAARNVQFYRIMVSTSPEEFAEPLDEREWLYTLNL